MLAATTAVRVTPAVPVSPSQPRLESSRDRACWGDHTILTPYKQYLPSTNVSTFALLDKERLPRPVASLDWSSGRIGVWSKYLGEFGQVWFTFYVPGMEPCIEESLKEYMLNRWRNKEFTSLKELQRFGVICSCWRPEIKGFPIRQP